MEAKPIDKYWSSFFGILPKEMAASGVRVVPHQELSNYQGAWVFRHNSLTIISVPNDLCQSVEENIRVFEGDLLTEDWVRAMFKARIERIIGPAYDGYLDVHHFRPAPSSGVRRLSIAEREDLQQLSQTCEETEWEHSGIILGELGTANELLTFGCFVNGNLVAASQYESDKQGMARGGVFTHPDYRQQGFGKAVRSAAATDCVNRGYTMLYQTLMSNLPSVALAQSLGFEQYATHLAIRFK